MAPHLTKCSDSNKLNRSMPLIHAPSKDMSFVFPETAASSMGLEREDASVVVTDSTGIVALTQSPKKSRLQNPIVLSNGSHHGQTRLTRHSRICSSNTFR
jgi:hypothetical protein